MLDPDTCRENLQYASYLRSQGYPTVVHALPEGAISLVNELLGKGWKGQRVSNVINRNYQQEILDSNLKPISRFAINTYREKYWKQSSALSNLILQGDNKTKLEIGEIKERYDSYKEMIKTTAKFDVMTDKAIEFTKNSPLPLMRVANLVYRSHQMHRDNLREEVRLGIWHPPVSKATHNTETTTELYPRVAKMSAEELKDGLVTLVQVMTKTGKYAEPKITGENLSGRELPNY